MPSITPVPTTRVSDALVTQRLLTQMRTDQSALFQLQTAISTGKRIQLPSEDASAAQRAISLQSLLERKQQVQVNLETNQSFLAATDTALSSVSAVLADIRGEALSVADTVSTPEAKRAVAAQVDRALEQLVDAGNQQFRGRYLFAGTRSNEQPFQLVDGHVRYMGDERSYMSFSDIDLLFATNVTGAEVFGAVSQEVRGTVELRPLLAADTRLRDLNGGLGIDKGSIAISDGTSTSIVDISKAETLGDLKSLLEANPPAGRTLSATITATGIDIALDAGQLTIKEVGGGTTAAELGILAETERIPPTVNSAPLNPQLRLTTRLADLPVSLDQTSGLQITGGGQTHSISIATAVTVEDLLNSLNGSKAGLLAEINATGTGINVRSRTSGTDFSIGENGGTTASDLGLRTFNRQTRLEELNHGFGVHARDGDDFSIRLKTGSLLTFDVSSLETVGDVLDLINTTAAGQVTARLATVGNGIELETTDPAINNSLAVLSIHGSQAAQDLGLIAPGKDISGSPTSVGDTQTLRGQDTAPLEAKGIFTALVRLRDALVNDDVLQIQRSLGVLDDAVVEMNFSRAELGARQQGLDVLKTRLEDEHVNLEQTLSNEIDADLVEVITEMTARQAAFEASLQLVSRSFQLSLLDFL